MEDYKKIKKWYDSTTYEIPTLEYNDWIIDFVKNCMENMTIEEIKNLFKDSLDPLNEYEKECINKIDNCTTREELLDYITDECGCEFYEDIIDIMHLNKEWNDELDDLLKDY